ncbi:MAG: hypothetical protein HYV76_01945 [Candidatus Vogelbacteria bacterium]|nr:hypothetical protein [Candidatus Vogelbacteria bacterium]
MKPMNLRLRDLGIIDGQEIISCILWPLAQWYDQFGNYLGQGDLGLLDLVGIAASLKPEECFCILPSARGNLTITKEMVYGHLIAFIKTGTIFMVVPDESTVDPVDIAATCGVTVTKVTRDQVADVIESKPAPVPVGH